MITYRIPYGVKEYKTGKHQCLAPPDSGCIIVDDHILRIWREADGKQISEIVENTPAEKQPEMILALGCLAEAGLLKREGEHLPTRPAKLSSDGMFSVIIVGFNSQPWLAKCIPSLLSQRLKNFEIIIVDNASSDNTVSWVSENHPQIKIIQMEQQQPLSYALNQGIQQAKGDYLLLLNPDVELEPTFIPEMAAFFQANPDCDAAAAKLLLLSNPGFINGIGNFVGPISWGTDYALGHLDLGQFDHLKLVPSACFAAAVITAKAYRESGAFDEGFPLYYEDSEWSYRARILGKRIYAVPQAVGRHAYSSQLPGDHPKLLSSKKLSQVVYGRLRFAMKLLSPPYFLEFLFLYTAEDIARLLLSIFRARWGHIQGIFLGWRRFIADIPEILQKRREIQNRRKVSDREIFQIQKSAPVVLIRDGFPQLTLDLLCNEYLPLTKAGSTRSLPEFDYLLKDLEEYALPTGIRGFYSRTMKIISVEGFSSWLHRVGRYFQWLIMRS